MEAFLGATDNNVDRLAVPTQANKARCRCTMPVSCSNGNRNPTSAKTAMALAMPAGEVVRRPFTLQLVAVAGNHKGPQLDLGVLAFGDVTHDGSDVCARGASKLSELVFRPALPRLKSAAQDQIAQLHQHRVLQVHAPK
jgi:hypothetical protein